MHKSRLIELEKYQIASITVRAISKISIISCRENATKEGVNPIARSE